MLRGFARSFFERAFSYLFVHCGEETHLYLPRLDALVAFAQSHTVHQTLLVVNLEHATLSAFS